MENNSFMLFLRAELLLGWG